MDTLEETGRSRVVILEQYIAPYLISNAVSVGLLVIAIIRPRLAPGLFVFLFLAAGLFNTYTALTEPEVYWDYEGMAVLELYKKFIAGFFSQHTKAIVLLIALGQLCIAALLFCGRNLRRLGVIGGCNFFVAIVPLGIGSAFPCTLLMAAGLVLMEYRLSKACVPQPPTPNKT
jgi:hypothetical protein